MFESLDRRQAIPWWAATLVLGSGLSHGPLQAATLNLTATPATVEAGSPARLDWTATQVTTCTATGGWNGPRPTAGQQSITPTITTTYVLRCDGTGGDVARSVTVGVKGEDCEESDVCTLDSPTRSCLFRVAITEEDATVRIAVREHDATFTARWRLVTAAATPASSCGSLRSGESDCGPLAPGDYTIQVSAAAGTGAATVHRQHLTRCPSTRIDCEQEVHDELTPAGDVDLFRFTTSVAERVRITVREVTGSFDAEWRLLTLTGARPGACDTFRRSLADDCGPLPPGEYQIQVRDELGSRTGAYAVHLQRLTTAVACDATAMICDQTLRGDLDPGTDSDLFRFGVEADEVARIVVDERGGNLVAEWRLLTDDGSPASACGTFTTARAADCGPLPAGTYLIQVKDDTTRRTGSYEISLFNLVHQCANCGNGIVTAGEDCDPPGPCCTSRCRFAAAGVICRGRAGSCDAAEHCTGTAAACPADRLLELGVLCRSAVDVCDAPEVCSGIRPDCPVDRLATPGTTCRAAAGDCDEREACNGLEPGCGPDRKRTGTCRSAAGPCDAPEVCDGESDTCPGNQVAPIGTVCRPATDHCDVEERCAGGTLACPSDQKVPLACGDGCRDPREQCGEPWLPECGGGQTCIGCVCLPCASGRTSCDAITSDRSLRMRLALDTPTPGTWSGTLRWDPELLRLRSIVAPPGVSLPTCVDDAESGTAACEGVGPAGASGGEVARATFEPLAGWPAGAAVTFGLTALAGMAGEPVPVCATSAECALGECLTAAECDDGDPCTRDACRDASCAHEPPTGFTGADCRIAQILKTAECGDQPLERRLVHLLYRRVAQSRRLLARAATAPSVPRRARFLERSQRALQAAQRRVRRSKSPRGCGSALVASLEDRREVVRRLADSPM